ncbi:uncharacterized protein LOC134257337, partial [Saccostrea cucullata]|uniref:uncharacterized protein LOC134257337 n=1 Tax=Saccostrea cuccullata TaxID=36930 RepID=UPI002ED66A4B
MFFKINLCCHTAIPVLYFLAYLSVPGRTSDPCNENVYTTSLTSLRLRAPYNILGPGELGICDRYIAKQWYRIDGYVLSTSTPEAFGCGTEFPMWMNDTFPGEGNISNVMICMRRYSDPCYERYSIQIKNCSRFMVYYFKPPSMCNAAYCFGVNETVKSVDVKFDGFLWTEERIDENFIQHDSAIRFLCSFPPLRDQKLYYRITWYLDDIEVDLNQVVNESTKLNATITAYEILRYGKKLGTVIQCRVWAVLQPDEKGCITRASTGFFAGIKVLTPDVSISTENGTTIKLKPNIPFADNFLVHVRGGVNLGRYLSIYLSDPAINCTEESSCECQGKSKNYYKCEQRIPSLDFTQRFDNDGKHNDWNKTVEFEVVVKKSIQYSFPPSEVILRLKTGNVNGNGSQFFNEVYLQDVTVKGIDEKSNTLPSCTSLTDPHMKSFDQV